VKEGIADPAKVCIMGASYGGYATLGRRGLLAGRLRLRRGHRGPFKPEHALEDDPPYWSTQLAVFHKRMGRTRSSSNPNHRCSRAIESRCLC